MFMWALVCDAAEFKEVMESCERVLANNHVNSQVLSICFEVSFQLFLQLLCLLCISLVFTILIFRCSAQILFKNALFCRQNARLKKIAYSESTFCRQNFSKPPAWNET